MLDKLLKVCYRSRRASQGKFHHWSFICDGNKIVSMGTNNVKKTHPRALLSGYQWGFPHSELSAILNFPYPPRELIHFSLYNLRLNRNNKVALSRPCYNCQKIIIAFGLRRCYYSNERGLLEELIY